MPAVEARLWPLLLSVLVPIAAALLIWAVGRLLPRLVAPVAALALAVPGLTALGWLVGGTPPATGGAAVPAPGVVSLVWRLVTPGPPTAFALAADPLAALVLLAVAGTGLTALALPDPDPVSGLRAAGMGGEREGARRAGAVAAHLLAAAAVALVALSATATTLIVATIVATVGLFLVLCTRAGPPVGYPAEGGAPGDLGSETPPFRLAAYWTTACALGVAALALALMRGLPEIGFDLFRPTTDERGALMWALLGAALFALTGVYPGHRWWRGLFAGIGLGRLVLLSGLLSGVAIVWLVRLADVLFAGYAYQGFAALPPRFQLGGTLWLGGAAVGSLWALARAQSAPTLAERAGWVGLAQTALAAAGCLSGSPVAAVGALLLWLSTLVALGGLGFAAGLLTGCPAHTVAGAAASPTLVLPGGRRLPLRVPALVLASLATLALAGVPPFGGAMALWLLGLGWLFDGRPALLVLPVLGSLLALYALGRALLSEIERAPEPVELTVPLGQAPGSVPQRVLLALERVGLPIAREHVLAVGAVTSALLLIGLGAGASSVVAGWLAPVVGIAVRGDTLAPAVGFPVTMPASWRLPWAILVVVGLVVVALALGRRGLRPDAGEAELAPEPVAWPALAEAGSAAEPHPARPATVSAAPGVLPRANGPRAAETVPLVPHPLAGAAGTSLPAAARTSEAAADIPDAEEAGAPRRSGAATALPVNLPDEDDRLEWQPRSHEPDPPRSIELAEVTVALSPLDVPDPQVELPHLARPRLPAPLGRRLRWRPGLPDPAVALGWLVLALARAVAGVFDACLGRAVR